ncbi:unnamed protein product [Dibothriocephalus latus]|uniref:Integrase zinc-binding domain-containing protein n=1 Tax=Dibothriocephalus latus TaxID=60516 RepID=A0A3P7LYH2_DIBLA|nr:unnamed protein product [Dibothriocephalus latus]
MEEVLEQVLLNYRVTPNGVFPAKALMQRKLRTPFDIIRPLSSAGVVNEPAHPTSMEGQFNRRHSAKLRLFHPSQMVLAKECRNNRAKWTLERVHWKCGDVVYQIRVGSYIWVRHANQLKHTECTDLPHPSPNLSLELLLDRFDLPKPR